MRRQQHTFTLPTRNPRTKPKKKSQNENYKIKQQPLTLGVGADVGLVGGSAVGRGGEQENRENKN